MSGPTNNNKKDIKSPKNVDEREEKIGQGELYSPNHAIKINTKNNQQNVEQKITQREELVKENNNNNNNNNSMVGRSVANDIKNKMVIVKEKLMEKLTAASVPSDALENAKQFFEGVIKDVTSAAQGLTKEALQKIKSHLADILPSLSPSLTSKMVDDAEKEATARESKGDDVKEMESETSEEQKGKPYASPASSFFTTYLVKPTSKL